MGDRNQRRTGTLQWRPVLRLNIAECFNGAADHSARTGEHRARGGGGVQDARLLQQAAGVPGARRLLGRTRRAVGGRAAGMPPAAARRGTLRPVETKARN